MEHIQQVQELQQLQHSYPQQSQQQYRRKPLEKMVGALLLDKVFRESFLSNPTSRAEAVVVEPELPETFRRTFDRSYSSRGSFDCFYSHKLYTTIL